MWKKSMILLLIVILGPLCAIDTKAESLGFVTEPFSTEEKSAFTKEIGLELLLEDNYGGGILCFDVRQDGTYALAFSSGPQYRIHVYDETGAYLYGYKFSCEGAFGIQFCDDSDCLAIYFTRSKVYALYDTTGTCIDVQKISSTDENLSLAQKILTRHEKTLSGSNYKLERDLNIGSTYSRLVLTDESGGRSVLYDNSIEHSISMSVWVVLVASFFAFVFWGIIRKERGPDK